MELVIIAAMPVIHFDCLIDAPAAAQMCARLAQFEKVLQDHGVLSELKVENQEYSQLSAGVVEQLRQIYLQEHDLEADDVQAEILEDFVPWRFSIQPVGYTGSINQLTMQLSRMWTPPAQMPKDAVQLEDEARFEVAARYPWTVNITA